MKEIEKIIARIICNNKINNFFFCSKQRKEKTLRDNKAGESASGFS